MSTNALVNFQTIRLGRGKHAGPTEGACVMELASMLAGEPFTDRPASVSPAIAAFMRAYNDSLDDRRRQQLFGCAAQVLGTRSTPQVEQQRIERWSEWAMQRRAQRHRLSRLYWRLRHGRRLSADTDVAAFLAVKSIGRHTDESHTAVLELIDELCQIGSGRVADPQPAAAVGRPQPAAAVAEPQPAGGG
jgi:hypothetical protein